MSGTFNGQILVEKLEKLNITQQSIETLSHWCIFHRKKAKEVVETWHRQFHCSPREQRLSFLYLANDILQNSRRKGSEFVDEFWKVLPAALTDVTENGDELGRNAAMRLTEIWEERKVFGSRGKVLKEEIMGRNLENHNKDGKSLGFKATEMWEERKVFGSRGKVLKEEIMGRNLENHNKDAKSLGFKAKQSIGSILEKIISGYEVIYDKSKDEEALLSKCKEAIRCVDRVKNEIGGDYSSAQANGSDFVEELQGQHGILGECIEKLRVAESSRATLVSNLKEALQQQELELEQVRTQLQVAQSQSEQAGNICQQLLQANSDQPQSEQRSKGGNTFSGLSSTFTSENLATSGDKEQSAPVMYTRQAPSFPNNTSQGEEDPLKSAAAAVVAKLTASTSSAQMLTYVLSSLASEGVIGKPSNGSSDDYPSEKRPRLDNPQSSYMQPSQQPQQPPPPPFPHPDSLHPQPPPPSSSSPLPPVAQTPSTTHFMQTAGSMTSVPYSYGSAPQRPPPLPGYPMPGTPLTGLPPYPSPPNPYQNFQGSGSGFYSNPPPLPATPPISRQ